MSSGPLLCNSKLLLRLQGAHICVPKTELKGKFLLTKLDGLGNQHELDQQEIKEAFDMFDTKTKRWNQNNTKIKGKQSLNKRINLTS